MQEKQENNIEIPEYIEDLLKAGEQIDEIRLDKEGNWFHNGVGFENKKIIDFFNKSIAKTKEGEYVLHYDRYVYPIIVEDTPIFITGVRFEGFADFEKVFLNLSTGNTVELDPATLYYNSNNNALYCTVSTEGIDEGFPAKFKRSPSFHILDRLDETNGSYFLNICGKRISLKQIND
ncbi:MAG: DUF1285 domain-containing protein [bacterium]|nr:DUF1285 domain-containing protein [bacterium]